MGKKGLLAVLVLIVLLTGCAKPETVSTDPKAAAVNDQTLTVYCDFTYIKGLDPNRYGNNDGQVLLANSYETLTRYNQNTGNIEPLLATSWSVGKDYQTWVFKIREGVLFHDGEPLTAEAVVLSYRRAIDNDPNYEIYSRFFKSIEATGDYEVTIVTHEYHTMDYLASSVYGLYIVSPKALAASAGNDGWYDSQPSAGTGPYQITGYTAGETAVLERYSSYWNGQADNSFQAVHLFHNRAELPNTLAEPGAAVVAAHPSQAETDLFLAAGGQSVVSTVSINQVGMFNTKLYPTHDENFRKALIAAFPYEQAAACGLAFAGGLVPSGIPGAKSAASKQANLSAAAAYLEKSDVDPGAYPIELLYLRVYMEDVSYLQQYQKNLETLGITLVLTEVSDWNAFYAIAQNPETELRQHIALIEHHSDYPHPKAWFLRLLAAGNGSDLSLTGYYDVEIEYLIYEAEYQSVKDLKQSLPMFAEIQAMADQAGLFLYAGDQQTAFAVTGNIEGFAPQKIVMTSFYIADLRYVPPQEQQE